MHLTYYVHYFFMTKNRPLSYLRRMDKRDVYYMQRCMQLAAQGLGYTYPNPLVGCVIVKNDRIIGEGWHKKAGEAHAEIDAFDHLKAGETAEGATLYVNLEPCAHYGRTPPCSDRIVREKLARVVIANTDPNPQVAGRGIQRMKDVGIEVTEGVCREEGERLNRRFFTFHRHQRPYIILKWAESADGYLAPENAEGQVRISDDHHRRQNHRWRAEEAAILVGRNTAAVDNPQLNLRHWTGNPPLRIAIDRKGNLSPDLHLFDGQQKTLIFTASKKQYPNAEVLRCKMDDWSWLSSLTKALYERDIQSLIVEGGGETLRAFYKAGLYDEIRAYRNEGVVFGGGVKAIDGVSF